MKRIYVVSLDDEVPLSPELIDSMKVLGFLVYEEVMGIEYSSIDNILLHDNIKYNQLLERKENNTYTHRFINNTPETGVYEPFMVNDRAFAFTVNDGMLNSEDIENILDRVKIYVDDYDKINIDSVTYQEDTKNKNRLLAIRKLLTKDYGNKEDKKTKTRVKSILSLLI